MLVSAILRFYMNLDTLPHAPGRIKEFIHFITGFIPHTHAL
jgi:hypothetical protein